MERLKKRADFVRVAQGRALRMSGFVLQYSVRSDGLARLGFTVTKRQGGAAKRNRIKRRLRAAVRLCPIQPRAADYVMIGRASVLMQPFAVLQQDVAQAFRQTQARRVM